MIRISKEHGVNPAIPICFYCGEEKNEIILAGHLPGDKEAPRHAVWNMEPCDKCKEYMEQGIILISVKDNTSKENPYRTGGWVVVKEEALKQIIPEDHPCFKSRFCFIEDAVWEKIGLPNINGKEEK